jgi:hypothetical protein
MSRYRSLGGSSLVSRTALTSALLALVACSPKRHEEKHLPKRATAEAEPMFDDVVPVGYGAAYAHGIPSGQWYLKGGEAVPVRVIGDSAVRSRFESAAILLKIQPTGDGKAYGFGFGGGLWRLEGDSIVPVAMRSSLSASSGDTPLGDLSIALTQRERRRAKREQAVERK